MIVQPSVCNHRLDVVEAVVARSVALLPNLVAAVWRDRQRIKTGRPPTIYVKISRPVTPARLRYIYLALPCVRAFRHTRVPVPCRPGPIVNLKIVTDIASPSGRPRFLYLPPAPGPSAIIPRLFKVTLSCQTEATETQGYPVDLIATLAMQLATDGIKDAALTIEGYGGKWYEGGGQAAATMVSTALSMIEIALITLSRRLNVSQVRVANYTGYPSRWSSSVSGNIGSETLFRRDERSRNHSPASRLPRADGMRRHPSTSLAPAKRLVASDFSPASHIRVSYWLPVACKTNKDSRADPPTFDTPTGSISLFFPSTSPTDRLLPCLRL